MLEAHSLTFLARIQSRNWKALTLLLFVVVLLAGVSLFTWSGLSADTADESVDSLLLCCFLVLFMGSVPRGRLVLALYALPKLSSIWYSTLKRPG